MDISQQYASVDRRLDNFSIAHHNQYN